MAQTVTNGRHLAPTPGYSLVSMPLSFLCYECGKRSNAVSDAMRRHVKVVHVAIDQNGGQLDRIEQQELKDTILASFVEAQAAWDSYREHLVKHGVVSTVRSSRPAA